MLQNYLVMSDFFCTFASQFKINTIMAKKQLKKEIERKTRQLIRESAQRMRKNIARAFNSGAIDITAYGDDYELPKIILGALLREEAFQYKMHTDEGRKAVENLAVCL